MNQRAENLEPTELQVLLCQRMFEARKDETTEGSGCIFLIPEVVVQFHQQLKPKDCCKMSLPLSPSRSEWYLTCRFLHFYLFNLEMDYIHTLHTDSLFFLPTRPILAPTTRNVKSGGTVTVLIKQHLHA